MLVTVPGPKLLGRGHLCHLGQVTSMDAVMDLAFVDGDASLARSTGANGQDEVGLLVAHHGASVIGSIVGRGAHSLAGRAVDDDTGWVAWVVLHRRNNLHATRREGVAVDVGEIVRDLAIGPGELELRDGSGGGGIGCKLDRNANTFLTVAFAIASLELLHARVGAASDRCIIDGIAAVVDDGGGSQGQDGRGRGKQHGCASNEVLELHVDGMEPWNR